jgi:hypothetical protein
MYNFICLDCNNEFVGNKSGKKRLRCIDCTKIYVKNYKSKKYAKPERTIICCDCKSEIKTKNSVKKRCDICANTLKKKKKPEKQILCMDCNNLFKLHKNSHNQKRCSDCAKIHTLKNKKQYYERNKDLILKQMKIRSKRLDAIIKHRIASKKYDYKRRKNLTEEQKNKNKLYKKEYEKRKYVSDRRKLKHLLQNQNKKCIECGDDILPTFANYCFDCRYSMFSGFSIPCIFIFNEKKIWCASKLEKRCLEWICKNIPNITDIDRAEFIKIPYVMDGKNKNYLPDFKIKTNKDIYIVEVKSKNTKGFAKFAPNYIKSIPFKKEALFNYCNNNGFIDLWIER